MQVSTRALRNRVVLRPGLTAYDSWDPLVKACRAYVQADLRSSALGAKAPLATVAGARPDSSAPKRQIHEPVPDSKRSKKAQQRRLNAAQQQPNVPQPAPPASHPAGNSSASGRGKKNPRKDAIHEACAGTHCRWSACSPST